MHDTQRTEIMVAADLPRSDFTVRRALQVGNALSNSASFTFSGFLHRSYAFRTGLPGLIAHSKWAWARCSKQRLEPLSQDTAHVCRQLRDTHALGCLITLKVALRPSENSGGDKDVSLPDFNASVPTFQTKKQNWVLKAQHSKPFEKQWNS